MTSNDQPILTFIALKELFPECTNFVSLVRAGYNAGLITDDEMREMRNYAMRDILPINFNKQ